MGNSVDALADPAAAGAGVFAGVTSTRTAGCGSTFELGEYLQPVFGALTAVTGPTTRECRGAHPR
ncbi:hypothetical protein [Alloactinosynnema sp. L-07]|nr:hypothetical protein [Alloactinosynnema sp. L-07]